MYCSFCGTKSAKGLKYCKTCGSPVGNANSEVRNQVAKTFSLASVLMGVFGVIGFGIVLKSMLENGVGTSYIFLMAALYLAAIGGIIFFLVRQVLRLIGIEEDRFPPDDDEQPIFKPAITARLAEHREPASVVDETTRNLEEVPVDRN